MSDEAATNHPCPGAACGHQVIDGDLLMCPDCWRRLSKGTRKRLYIAQAALRREDNDDHRAWVKRCRRAAVRELEQREAGTWVDPAAEAQA